jgi:hypothetical protein
MSDVGTQQLLPNSFTNAAIALRLGEITFETLKSSAVLPEDVGRMNMVLKSSPPKLGRASRDGSSGGHRTTAKTLASVTT